MGKGFSGHSMDGVITESVAIEKKNQFGPVTKMWSRSG